MPAPQLEQRRTVWDVVLGVGLVVLGLVVLANTVFATALSVLVLGWLTLLGGIALLAASPFRAGRGAGFWSAALGGGLLVVLGVVMLRNPAATALTLTLVAGALFLTTGLTRVVGGLARAEGRWVLVASGLVSVVLGLLVLLNLFQSTLTLLGVLLGVQALVEGVTLLAVGRMRPAMVSDPSRVAARTPARP